MSLDTFETEELTSAHNLVSTDGLVTEASMKAVLDVLGSGLSEDDVHDMFVVGGAKEGFDLKKWLAAFAHKDHGDQDDEVTSAFAAVSSGGALDMGKAETLIKLAGLDLKPKEFEAFKNIADYDSDGKVSLEDFVNMIHAQI